MKLTLDFKIRYMWLLFFSFFTWKVQFYPYSFTNFDLKVLFLFILILGVGCDRGVLLSRQGRPRLTWRRSVEAELKGRCQKLSTASKGIGGTWWGTCVPEAYMYSCKQESTMFNNGVSFGV